MISYNGIDLEEPFETLEFSKTPIVDAQNNYLYTRVLITVAGYYSPSSTAYKLGGEAPVAAPGQKPDVTETSVRHKLAQSRGKLVYSVPEAGGENPLVTSPAEGYTVDAANGPVSKVHYVKDIWGNKTFAVSFTVETFINEAHLFVDNPPVLLSNTWSATHEVERDGWTTRVLRGRAVFRTDLMAKIGAVPDDFRDLLFQPVPLGFKRTDVHVTATDDGAECEYEVIDEQQPYSVIFPGVSWIEVERQSGVGLPGAEALVRKLGKTTVEQVSDTAGTIGSVIDAFKNLSFGTALSETFNSFIRGGGRLVNHFDGSVPRRFENIGVRVWGFPRSRRLNLHVAAAKILAAYIAKFGLIHWSAAEIVGGEDGMGKYAELSARFEFGPLLAARTAGVGIRGNNTWYAALASGKTWMAGGASDALVNEVPGVFQEQGPAVGPPGDGGTRGNYIGRAVAAALLGQDQWPQPPADPGPFKPQAE